MRLFPYEYEAQKEIHFYPAKPESFEADILEIGPGRGDWILKQAALHPDKKFVAIELGKLRYTKLKRKIEEASLKNILLIFGDARLVLPQYFKEDTFEKVFVMFPDPWPKERHSFRRLLQIEFLTMICHFTKKSGLFLLATDVKSYASWSQQNIEKIPAYQMKQISPETLFPEYVTTHFEQKWRSLGRQIHYVLAEKNEAVFENQKSD